MSGPDTQHPLRRPAFASPQNGSPQTGSSAVLPWAAATVAAAVVAGLLASQGLLWSAGSIGLVLGGAFAVATFWRLEVGLIGLLFTLPLDQYGRVISSPVTLTVFQLVLFVALASWALRIVGDPKGWLRFSALDIGIGAIVLAGLWSLPTSLSRTATVVAIARLLFLWAMTLMYANGLRDNDMVKRFVAALVITGVLIGLLALAQYFVPGFNYGSIVDVRKAGGGIALSRAGGLFYDPNQLATFMSVAFVAGFAMLIGSVRRREMLAWTAGCAVTGAALLVTFSRTGWVGAFIGCIIVGLTAPRGRRSWVLGIGIAILLAVVVIKPDLILERTQSITNVSTDTSVATRYYMTFSALDMIHDMPVFGTGLGAFDQAYRTYRRPGTLLTIVKPHQIPLALWAETGIAGLLAQLTLVGALVALFWRRRPKGWTTLESMALAGVITILVQTLFQYYLYFEYVWLFLALSVVATRLARSDEEAA